MCRFACLLFVLCLFDGLPVQGATIYVDSRVGSNALDGLAPIPNNRFNGPVKTLCHAMSLVCSGDTIELVDNGTPYYGSLSLVGSRFSGAPGSPLRLFGNGATITGCLPISASSWQDEGDNLWRITPIRKGHYQLLREETPVPEADCPDTLAGLPNVPPGHWCASRGRIYYRAPVGEDPREETFQLANDDVGLTLQDVHDVWVRDVTFQNFRLDGINAADRCQNVLLENITCRGNGRAGLAVGGSSHVHLRNSRLVDNRQHSLLITELGSVQVDDSQLNPPATVAP